MQQIGSNPPPVTAANHVPQNTTAAQEVQHSTYFDIPIFKGDSAASWLTWSQRVAYQARACGFEAELAAVVGEELSASG